MGTGRDFIGPFQLIRLIRSGNTTQVWEAIREGEKERVALKVLLQSQKDNKVEIEQLKHETAVAKDFDHPNVIKIFDYHGNYGIPFISMQLFNAKNLKLEMRERQEFFDQNLQDIVRLCAEGLKHIHEKGWLHCDIKPDNYLADEQGTVKLIDFSIAQKLKTGFSLFGGSKSKVIKGTRSYISPEQIRREKLDIRSDVYSFGCMLYELTSGRLPFTAVNPDDLLNKHLRSPVPSLLSAARGVNPDFNDLVMQMLAKKPGDRPADMGEFLLRYNRMRIFRGGVRVRQSKDSFD
ncbi:MAG: serine/threonine-protein kinase [Pirellulaceae bacterium]